METKKCNKCGKIATKDAFPRRGAVCKECRDKYMKVYYTRPEVKERQRKDYKKHRQKYYNKLKSQTPWVLTYFAISTRCRNKMPNCTHFERGIKCLITKDELKSLWFRDKAYELKKPSIDRINEEGNYAYDNCQYIEMSENSRKCAIYYKKLPPWRRK